MEKYLTSIFNDVIGPVMRGPSSSHAAASARIGRMLRMAAKNKIKNAVIEYDINGSLAETHDGQGSDMGLASGFLGFDLTDPRVPDAIKIAKAQGIDIRMNILDYGANHPNNYRIRIFTGDGREHCWEAISSGGGMIKIWSFNSFEISVMGDYYELLIIAKNQNASRTGGASVSCGANGARAEIEKLLTGYEYITESLHGGLTCINVKAASKINDEIKNKIAALGNVLEIVEMDPVLPTQSKRGCSVPFSNAEVLLQYVKNDNREMWQLASYYESVRGSI